MSGSGFNGGRLFFTAVAAGAHGSRFQTFAVARGLADRMSELESPSVGFDHPHGEDSGESARTTRQVTRFERSSEVGLTTFTPLGRCPDGRPGNYLAETVVVPAGWIDRLHGDFHTAFGLLPATDPQAVPTPCGTPRLLEDEVLPESSPGPLARLRTLRDRVGTHAVTELAFGVVQRIQRGQGIAVVASHDAAPELLDTVILLTPLLVPPRFRRKLTLRTRAKERSFPVDLMGVERDSPASQDSAFLRIDLDGPGSTFGPLRAGLEYVSWLHDVIDVEDWALLEACYVRADGDRGCGFFESFREIRDSL